jgi:tetratricopeptide (TPR) repeat protein
MLGMTTPIRIAIAASLACVLTATADPASTGSVSRGVGMVEAYQDLLKENLELRSETAALGAERDAAKHERDRLQSNVNDMEKQLVETATALQALQKAHDAQVATAGEASALQARVATAEAERTRLTAELAALQAQLAATPSSAAGPAVATGSDMYRKVDAERAALQQRVKEVEAERNAAARAADALRSEAEERKAETETLQATLQAQGSEREAMAKIVPHVRRLQEQQRELEKDLAACEAEKDAVEKRAEDLDVRARQLTKLSSRLLRGGGGKLQEGSGEPTEQSLELSSDPFQSLCQVAANMARKSQFKLSAAAYQRSLKLRPDAADVHYNLGILYDQELKDTRKAIRHYSEYLRLCPFAADSDQVRAWLMEARVRE